MQITKTSIEQIKIQSLFSLEKLAQLSHDVTEKKSEYTPIMWIEWKDMSANVIDNNGHLEQSAENCPKGDNEAKK